MMVCMFSIAAEWEIHSFTNARVPKRVWQSGQKGKSTSQLLRQKAGEAPIESTQLALMVGAHSPSRAGDHDMESFELLTLRLHDFSSRR